jgi:peptidoglycan-associated lipoprotein
MSSRFPKLPNFSRNQAVNPAAGYTEPPKSTGRTRFLLVLIFRLLLLGVGGGFAGLLGVLVAHFYPAPSTQTVPLLEKGFRWADRVVTGVKRLPQTGPRLFPPDQQRSPAATPSAATNSPLVMTSPPQLTATQRQQLQTELDKLQVELETLRDRATTLETQVGSSRANEDLEARLQVLSQQLNPSTSSPARNPASPIPSSSVAATINQPVVSSRNTLQPDALMVTLPSDILFKGNQTTLRPETHPILDDIATDLRNYPKATIRISAHTDNLGNAKENRVLALQRAQAIEQYLSAALGDRYRWISVGYGQSRPLVENNSDLNRQRNRRIEVAIEP